MALFEHGVNYGNLGIPYITDNISIFQPTIDSIYFADFILQFLIISAGLVIKSLFYQQRIEGLASDDLTCRSSMALRAAKGLRCSLRKKYHSFFFLISDIIFQ